VKIIVGLGNPGAKYEKTRHNVGYRVVDLLRERKPIIRRYSTDFYRAWLVSFESQSVLIVKPQTYMNESGQAVGALLQDFHEEPESLILVHDDLDILLGGLKITARRGPGTHKGLLSIVSVLGRDQLLRVRIGIGQSQITIPRIDYVLSEFEPEEEAVVSQVLERAALACHDIVCLGLEKAMTRWNAEGEANGNGSVKKGIKEE